MVMEAARPDDDEVAGFPALACRQEPDLLDFRTIRVVRMGIRSHVMRPRVTVDEQHARADGNLDVLWIHAGGRDRDRIRLNDGRRAGRAGRGLAARGETAHKGDPHISPGSTGPDYHEFIVSLPRGPQRERGVAGRPSNRSCGLGPATSIKTVSVPQPLRTSHRPRSLSRPYALIRVRAVEIAKTMPDRLSGGAPFRACRPAELRKRVT